MGKERVTFKSLNIFCVRLSETRLGNTLLMYGSHSIFLLTFFSPVNCFRYIYISRDDTLSHRLNLVCTVAMETTSCGLLAGIIGFKLNCICTVEMVGYNKISHSERQVVDYCASNWQIRESCSRSNKKSIA